MQTKKMIRLLVLIFLFAALFGGLSPVDRAQAQVGVTGGGTDDYYEENDYIIWAYDLSGDEGTWLSALPNGLADQEDKDYFQIFVSPGQERVQIEVDFLHVEGNIQVALMDFDGNRVAEATSDTDDESIDTIVPKGGETYYILVYGENASNQYDLRWFDVPRTPSDIYEDDDDYLSASPIIPNDTQEHIIAPLGDPDWVTFTVDGNQAVVIETSGDMGPGFNTWMALYASGFSSLNDFLEEDDDSGTSTHAKIDRTCHGDLLPAGTYYVRVEESGEDALISSYLLSLMIYPCLGAFSGGATINSSQPVVAIGRPHMGTEIMAYNGTTTPSTLVYLPMLFKNKWGYESTFTVMNSEPWAMVEYDLVFRNADTGAQDCVLESEYLYPHDSRTYDLSTIGVCTPGSLPSEWYGSVNIVATHPVAAVGKPMVGGTDAVTYSGVDGLTAGSHQAFLPMLFKDKWGYQAAFYIQNVDSVFAVDPEIYFYDSAGNFTCRYDPPGTIPATASKGYWMGSINNSNCDDLGLGTGFPASGGWAGSALIISVGMPGPPIVALGRPHMGAEVAVYNGFADTDGHTNNYLPMLFRGQWGYDSAFYIQNVTAGPVGVTIYFYDTAGNYNCYYLDPIPIESFATRGYWLPSLDCSAGASFPPGGWAGSAKIISTGDVVAVGRPHLSNGQVVVYNAFTGGNTSVDVPMLFRDYSGSESALYIQNLGSSPADTVISFTDQDSGYFCSMRKTIQPGASGAIWLAGLEPTVCIPK